MQLETNNPLTPYNCPYCVAKTNGTANNVAILCRWCRGTGKVSSAVRDYWRSQLPVRFRKPLPNDYEETFF